MGRVMLEVLARSNKSVVPAFHTPPIELLQMGPDLNERRYSEKFGPFSERLFQETRTGLKQQAPDRRETLLFRIHCDGGH